MPIVDTNAPQFPISQGSLRRMSFQVRISMKMAVFVQASIRLHLVPKFPVCERLIEKAMTMKDNFWIMKTMNVRNVMFN